MTLSTRRAPRRTLKETFDLLVKCAVNGERCPLSHWDRVPSQPPIAAPDLVSSEAINKLAHQGQILIEISGRNWRTITILVGPNKGRKTAPDPYGHQVWQTIGTTRTLNTTSTQRAVRAGPSAPRRIGF